MSKYILGVDGGNTKTDVFLFTEDGTFAAHERFGTCSHENMPDSYTGAKRALSSFVNAVLARVGAEIADVKAAAMGLAGIDIPVQRAAMQQVIAELGFRNFIAVNDAFLGIKAGTSRGVGICSINGTGMCTGGIDDNGDMRQIGGIGWVSGDDAGGGFLAQSAMRAVYDMHFRCGPPTAMSAALLELLGCRDEHGFAEAYTTNYLMGKIAPLPFNRLLFEHANSGDAVAQRIVLDTGRQLARSAAGCIHRLHFDGTVEIILAGSVWVKAGSPLMRAAFEQTLRAHVEAEFQCIPLDAPPASGAVIWGMQLASGRYPALEARREIIDICRTYDK